MLAKSRSKQVHLFQYKTATCNSTTKKLWKSNDRLESYFFFLSPRAAAGGSFPVSSAGQDSTFFKPQQASQPERGVAAALVSSSCGVWDGAARRGAEQKSSLALVSLRSKCPTGRFPSGSRGVGGSETQALGCPLLPLRGCLGRPALAAPGAGCPSRGSPRRAAPPSCPKDFSTGGRCLGFQLRPPRRPRFPRLRWPGPRRNPRHLTARAAVPASRAGRRRRC